MKIESEIGIKRTSSFEIDRKLRSDLMKFLFSSIFNHFWCTMSRFSHQQIDCSCKLPVWRSRTSLWNTNESRLTMESLLYLCLSHRGIWCIRVMIYVCRRYNMSRKRFSFDKSDNVDDERLKSGNSFFGCFHNSFIVFTARGLCDGVTCLSVLFFSLVEQELRFKRSFKSAFKYSLDLFFIHYASLLMDNLCAHQENTKIHAEWFRQSLSSLNLANDWAIGTWQSKNKKCKKQKFQLGSTSQSPGIQLSLLFHPRLII